MHTKRSRLALLGTLTLALSVTIGMFGAADAAKKGKKKKAKSVTVTKTNLAIPDRNGAGGAYGRLDVPLEVGKKFKGRVVGPAGPSVTYQTTGSAAGAANDLEFELVAPSGRKQGLLSFIGDQNIGPLTVTANSPVDLCDTPTPPCDDPDQTLLRPFAGTAGQEDLGFFVGQPMRGTWHLYVTDDSFGDTNTLNLVKLFLPAA